MLEKNNQVLTDNKFDNMTVKQLNALIVSYQKSLNGLLESYEGASKAYRKKTVEYDKAQKQLEAKPNKTKVVENAKRATDELGVYANSYLDLSDKIDDTLSALSVACDTYAQRLFESKGEKSAAKAQNVKDQIIGDVEYYKGKIEASIPLPAVEYPEDEKQEEPEVEQTEEVSSVEETPTEEINEVQTMEQAPDYEAKIAELEEKLSALTKAQATERPVEDYRMAPPQYAPASYPQFNPMYYPYPTRPDVQVAPVSVDISSAVDKAVRSAMEQFGTVLKDKVTTVSSDTVKGAQAVAEGEKAIMEQLTALMNNVKALNEELAVLTETVAKVTESQKQIAELQKQTNDVQRYTLREQQGVQVNQKVLSTDQLAVVEQQEKITEQQRTVAERQALTADAENVLVEQSKIIMDTENSLGDEMKKVIDLQKEIVNKQTEMLKANAMNVDIQNEISSVQSQITSAQKEALSGVKAVMREQRGANEKIKANADLQVEIAEGIKTAQKGIKSAQDKLAKAN